MPFESGWRGFPSILTTRSSFTYASTPHFQKQSSQNVGTTRSGSPPFASRALALRMNPGTPLAATPPRIAPPVTARNFLRLMSRNIRLLLGCRPIAASLVSVLPTAVLDAVQQDPQLRVAEAVDGEAGVPLDAHDSGHPQDAELLRDDGLRDVEPGGQRPDGRGFPGEHAQDPEPDRMRDGLQEDDLAVHPLARRPESCRATGAMFGLRYIAISRIPLHRAATHSTARASRRGSGAAANPP